MPELAISTWSLHRELGATYQESAAPAGERIAEYPYGKGAITLLDLPRRLAEAGIHRVEICHFHFPRVDDEYLGELQAHLLQSGVTFQTLLIDSGDITADDEAKRRRDLDWIKRWVTIAGKAGAERARVIAGDASPGAEAIELSVRGLQELNQHAQECGVELITENWHALTMDPTSLLAILDAMEGELGLCADFGNYSGPRKYDDLAAILPRAATTHAKAQFPRAGEMDEVDFRRCLDIAKEAGFNGPHVLIFDSAGEEWPSLNQMAQFAAPYL